MPTDSVQPKLFKTPADWEKWLESHHTDISGIWLRLAKKGSGLKCITYAEALEVALCYGWIDSQTRKYDEQSFIQKFTPRRSRSVWSQINVAHIERLTREGRMKPAGLREVERAKQDGRLDVAYGSQSTMEVPADFLKELKKDTKAYEFYKTLNRSNTYAIAWRLHTAKKPETRQRRVKKFLDMMKNREKLY